MERIGANSGSAVPYYKNIQETGNENPKSEYRDTSRHGLWPGHVAGDDFFRHRLWRLNEVVDSTRSMMQEPLKKEQMTEEWYRITVAGLKRTLAIVKSSDESTLGKMRKTDKRLAYRP